MTINVYICFKNEDSREVRFCLLVIQIKSWMELYQSIQNRQFFQSISTRTITAYGKSYSSGARVGFTIVQANPENKLCYNKNLDDVARYRYGFHGARGEAHYASVVAFHKGRLQSMRGGGRTGNLIWVGMQHGCGPNLEKPQFLSRLLVTFNMCFYYSPACLLPTLCSVLFCRTRIHRFLFSK